MPCSVTSLAESMSVSTETLHAAGATDCRRLNAPAVKFPCLDARGDMEGEIVCMTPPNAHHVGRWDRSKATSVFSLEVLREATVHGEIVVTDHVVESLALRHRGVSAISITGSGADVPWDDLLDGFDRLFVPFPVGCRPPEFVENMSRRTRERVWLMPMTAHGSVRALSADPSTDWQPTWAGLVDASASWTDYLTAKRDIARVEAQSRCEDLVAAPNLVERFGRALDLQGFAGDTAAAKLLFLIATSRVLDRPVSAAVKGPSSVGKSFLVKSVLRFFPGDAFHLLTAMTDKALVYDREPLEHRVLVIQETAGMGTTANLIVRSLLSEGRIDYQTVQSVEGELQAVRIVRDGPTSLITTTTQVLLHRENETRVISITVADTKDQTREVMRAIAAEDEGRFDPGPWHALQEYLALGDNKVSVPFGGVLADATEIVALRMRRDFSTVLGLIRAHALLQQGQRERDAQGRIVATFDDYDAVRDLLEDDLADGLEHTVSEQVRAVARGVLLLFVPNDEGEGVTVQKLAQHLGLDRSTVHRQVAVAIEREFVRNLGGQGRGRAKLLAPGEPLPDTRTSVLPSGQSLRLMCNADSSGLDHPGDTVQTELVPAADTSGGDEQEMPF